MIELTEDQILQLAKDYLHSKDTNKTPNFYVKLVKENLDQYWFYTADPIDLSDYYLVYFVDKDEPPRLGDSDYLGVSKKEGTVRYLGRYGE